jgi:uncharacterized protein
VALVNLLEPPDLIREFQSNLPEGFAPVEFPAPAFATRFDLLTTLEPSARKRIGWLPLPHPMTCFIGTTVSEYALFPSEINAEDLVAEVQSKLARRFAFVIIKDLPTEPVLAGEEALERTRRIASACEAAGFVLMDGQALAYVPIDFASVDAYLARLSHSRRKNLRRKLKQRHSVEIDAIPTGDERLRDEEFLSKIYSLYMNVYEQSEIHFDLLTKDFFRAVLQSKTANGILFVYRSNGHMIGWNLCFCENGILIDKYIGFEYPAAREQDLYTVSWFNNLEFAVNRGLRCYVAGWTDPEIKRQLGARFTPTQHAVHVRNPLLRGALKVSKRWFESDRQWYANSDS